ncbi:MAG: NAD(P)H-dependent oxidoreductase [Acidimicrobiia bacterium]|nr:NAD(P)H-dependent oxidoreductase [Acidimicrobiia bacterium]
MQALVICAHPDGDSYTHAVLDAAVKGIRRAGHDVTVLDLYAIGFTPAMSLEERRAYRSAEPLLDPMTVEHAALVKAAEMFVFVYPTWWSGLPAIMKGWLERVLVPGVAIRFDDSGKVRPALTHVKRIVGISTYGSPWTYVKLLTDGGRRTLTRSFRMSGRWRTPTTWLGLYSIDTAGDAERSAFIDRVEHTMAHLDRVHEKAKSS